MKPTCKHSAARRPPSEMCACLNIKALGKQETEPHLKSVVTNKYPPLGCLVNCLMDYVKNNKRTDARDQGIYPQQPNPSTAQTPPQVDVSFQSSRGGCRVKRPMERDGDHLGMPLIHNFYKLQTWFMSGTKMLFFWSQAQPDPMHCCIFLPETAQSQHPFSSCPLTNATPWFLRKFTYPLQTALNLTWYNQPPPCQHDLSSNCIFPSSSQG